LVVLLEEEVDESLWDEAKTG